MSKAYFKETLRSFKHNLSRFLSIVAVVILGSGVFVGYMSTCPDMLRTSAEYYKTSNLYDIRLQSFIGLYEGDLEQIRQMEGVKAVVGEKFVDGFVKVKGNDGAYQGLIDLYGSQMTLRAFGFDPSAAMSHTEDGGDEDDYINRLTLLEGEYPDEVGECVVSCNKIVTPSQFKIGETFKLEGDGESILYSLKTDEFKIVGIVMTPYFVSFDRGTTLAGSGKLGDYIYIPNDSFTEEVNYYSEAYITLDESYLYGPYEDGYNDYVDSVAKRIRDASGAIVAARAVALKAEIEPRLVLGENEFAIKQQEAAIKLAQAKKQLDDVKYLVQNGAQMIAQAQAELETKYAQAIEQINNGNTEYNAGLQEYNINAQKVADGQIQWDQANEEYNRNKELYDEAEAQLKDAKNQITLANAQVVATKQLIAATQATLDNLRNNSDANNSLTPQELEQMADRLEATNPELARVLRTAAYMSGAGVAENTIAEVEALLDRRKAELAAEEIKLARAQTLYAEKETELAAAKVKLDSAKAELNAKKKELEDGKKKLEEAKERLRQGGLDLQMGNLEAQTKYLNAKAEIALKQAQLSEVKSKLPEHEAQYAAKKAEIENQVDVARTMLQKGKAVLQNLGTASWSVTTRRDLPGYSSYGNAAYSMQTIALVFSVFFYIVATFVCLTTMTRMVQEERTQLGVLKAIGYTNRQIVSKYLIYSAVACVVGLALGISGGTHLFPKAFVIGWTIMYEQPELKLYSYPLLIVIGFVITMILTMTAVTVACSRELRLNTAQLMRPKPPKFGKRVFLEKIGFIWKRLGFTSKVTIRNLLRSKKRLLFSVLGIGGCTALLVAGFGFVDSARAVILKQFNEDGIARYGIQIALKDEQTGSADSKVVADINSLSGVHNTMLTHLMMYRSSVSADAGGSYDVNIYVPEAPSRMDEYVRLIDYKTGKLLTLDDSGAIITDNFAKAVGAKVGDTVTVSCIEGTKEISYKIKVAGIVRNYTFHYIYMTPAYYQQLTAKAPTFNCLTGHISNDLTPESRLQLEKQINELAGVNGSIFTSAILDSFSYIIKSIYIIIAVIVVAAAMLAFVVLYILNSTNINEHLRELATLKVLGFYDGEVSAYIYRENIILMFFGILAGFGMGLVLHKLIIMTIIIDSVTLGQSISAVSYGAGTLITLLFAFLVNLVMHKYLKRLSMVESLKSVE